MSASWFFKRPPQAPAAQSVSGSPYSYTNTSKDKQICQVSGGTVSLIEINKGSGFATQVGTSGNYTLFPNEIIRITYSVAPTHNMVQH